MSSIIECNGDIEIFCFPSGSATLKSSVPFFDALTPGDRIAMIFTPGDDPVPPYSLKITSPTGSTILDTMVRDLPTGTPQSPPPIEFVVSVRGFYKIEIRELKGRQRGEAKLRVS